MWTIFSKELSTFLDSLIAYVVIGAFLSSMWLLLWFFPEQGFLDYGYADMGAFFGLCPYVLVFLIPAITMRSYAEERHLGTWELLLTAPLSVEALVVGKFLACVSLLGMCLVPSLLYYGSLYALGNPMGNIDSAQIAGSYVGLMLLGAVFCAIGQSSSALCRNQLVAFVLASFVCFVCYFGLYATASLDAWGWIGQYAALLSFHAHYQALGKGLIDLREIVFFLGCTALFLLLTYTIVRTQR